MPTKRPTGQPKQNPFASIRPETPRQDVADTLGELIYDLLVAQNDAEAIKLLRQLRRAVREREAARRYLGLRPMRKGGRPPGALSKKTRAQSIDVFIAVQLCGLSVTEVIRRRHKDSTWTPTSADYRWVDRRLKFGRGAASRIWNGDPEVAQFSALQSLSPANRKVFARMVLQDLHRKV